jgi:hypothetical protein
VNYLLHWLEVSIPEKVTLGSTMRVMCTSKFCARSVNIETTIANILSLAVQHALETTSVGDVPLVVQKYEVPTNSNPFILPWSMRGLLEEDFVKTDLHKEATDLLEQFDAWKPSTKGLKDVKFRLEAVRSKL